MSRMSFTRKIWLGGAALIGLMVAREAAGGAAGFVLACAAICLTAVLGALLVRGVARPLASLAQIAEELSAGRTEAAQRLAEFEPGGEEMRNLAGSLEKLGEGLGGLLDRVRQSGVQVSGSATEAAAAASEMQAAIAGQTASASAIVASGNRILSAAGALQRSVEKVRSNALAVAEMAGCGLAGVKDAERAIAENAAGRMEFSSALAGIEEQFAELAGAGTRMVMIANRTNLVSLNAAIEAEKAGANAAGFSVVALEIRRLADRTAAAALDIELSLSKLREAVLKAGGRAEPDETSATLAQAAAQLARVAGAVKEFEPQIEQASAAAETQTMEAQELLAAIEKFGSGRAPVEQVGAVAGQLRAAVRELQAAVAGFKEGS